MPCLESPVLGRVRSSLPGLLQYPTGLNPAFQDPATSRWLSSSGLSPAALGGGLRLKAWTVTGSRGLTDTELGQGQSSCPGNHRGDTVLLSTSEAFDTARV